MRRATGMVRRCSAAWSGLFVVGFLNGSITSGTGLFLTILADPLVRPRLHACGGLHADLCGLVWNGTGALVLGMIGTVAWSWMPALLAGSIIAAIWAATWRSGKATCDQAAFEIVTILIGLKLIFG